MGEKEIELEQENIIVYSGGGAVNSVNGYTGDVVLTTSDLENTSNYQTGDEVDAAIAAAIADKQDTLTAGANITIDGTTISATDTTYTAGTNVSISAQNVISATDTTYTAGSGLDLTGTEFSVDTNTIATKQSVTDEATARENADIGLQGQIDAISASSDVKDIVGTYAALQAYDTSTLGNNDIIKVLQDETHDDETTYYRWSTTTETFTLIGEEGPYYTKAATDTLLAAKQDKLTAGANITIEEESGTGDLVIAATDTTYTAGNGLNLTGTAFSVDTTTIQEKLTAGSNVTISGTTISATDTTYSDFVGTDGTAAGTAGLVPAPATTDAGKFLKADGTWDTAGGSGPTVVQTTGTSTTDVMSQNAVTSMVFADPATQYQIKIGAGTSTSEGANAVEIGRNSQASGLSSVALGYQAAATRTNAVAIGQGAIAGYANSVAIGKDATPTRVGEVNIGSGSTQNGFNSSEYRVLGGLYDGQSSHDAATKGQLDSIAIQNAGAPTTAKVGTVGQLLEDTTNGKLYICTDATNPYVWEEVGAGGGGPTVVQTTGTSTTDVMSQNAVTRMVFADPSARQRVRLGVNANADGERSTAVGVGSDSDGLRAVALGDSASASASSSVAIGRGSQATVQGQFDIGDRFVGGYNNSAYRLLTGLYDGQSAHDAATVGQITPLSDSSAPTTATVGRLGQIFIDTATSTAYMCVDATDPYVWKQISA